MTAAFNVWLIGLCITGIATGYLATPPHGWLVIGIGLLVTGLAMWVQGLPPSECDGYD